jgi:hypothetical protein
MTSLVLKNLRGVFLNVIFHQLYTLKSKLGLMNNFFYKINVVPNLLKDVKDYILMCKTIKRKKLKLKKHKFWKKWKARRNTNKKNKKGL